MIAMRFDFWLSFPMCVVWVAILYVNGLIDRSSELSNGFVFASQETDVDQEGMKHVGTTHGTAESREYERSSGDTQVGGRREGHLQQTHKPFFGSRKASHHVRGKNPQGPAPRGV